MRRRLYLAAGAVAALLVAFLAGRHSAPVEVREVVKVETKTVTVTEWRDRIVEKRVEGPVREVERIVEKPGAERVVTRWIERGPVTVDTSIDGEGSSASGTTSVSTASKTTKHARPGWRAGVAGSWRPTDLSLHPDSYTVEVDRRLFGTLWIGVRASTDKRLGAALSLEW